MSDDLISRSKLNKEFDEVLTALENGNINIKETISREEFCKCLKILRECVDEQPTAYDVEKVVAEIRRSSGNGYRDIDGDYVPPMIETKDAIDIVESGVVDG